MVNDYLKKFIKYFSTSANKFEGLKLSFIRAGAHLQRSLPSPSQGTTYGAPDMTSYDIIGMVQICCGKIINNEYLTCWR